MTDKISIGPTHLASTDNATLSGAVGPHHLHLYALGYNKEGELDKGISMHLSLTEVEELIKGLKRKLTLCYESRVEKL